jgi:hypothetical protein
MPTILDSGNKFRSGGHHSNSPRLNISRKKPVKIKINKHSDLLKSKNLISKDEREVMNEEKAPQNQLQRSMNTSGPLVPVKNKSSRLSELKENLNKSRKISLKSSRMRSRKDSSNSKQNVFDKKSQRLSAQKAKYIPVQKIPELNQKNANHTKYRIL